jgi:ketosteroid isomerase-like protein
VSQLKQEAASPRELVRSLVAAYNAKDLEALLDLYAPDARFWDPFHREGVTGRSEIGQLLGGLFAAYPDERMAVVTLAADGEHAVAELRSTGTTAAGDPFELDFTEVYEMRGGRIASCRVYLDPQQLPAQPEEGGGER